MKQQLKNKSVESKKMNYLILGVIALFFIIISLAGYQFFYLIPNQQRALQDERQKSQEEIQKIEAQNKANIQKVESDIKNIQKQDNVPNLPAIISKWHPVIGFIYCDFKYTDGVSYLQQTGSGTLILYPDGRRALLTNKHVVTDENGYSPSVCLVKFPEDSTLLTATKVSVFKNGADAAYLYIDNPDSYLKNMTSEGRAYCKTLPELGDKVIILGYPLVGSPTDLTATDGIISGYDGDYYVTSAKVEHGNSGGAAIDLKNNCYLGIPTYAVAGNIESLARILKWQSF